MTRKTGILYGTQYRNGTMAGNTKILTLSGLGVVKVMPRNHLGRRNYLDMRDQFLAHRGTLPYMLSSIPVITFSYPLVPPMLVSPFLIPATASRLTPKAKQVNRILDAGRVVEQSRVAP